MGKACPGGSEDFGQILHGKAHGVHDLIIGSTVIGGLQQLLGKHIRFAAGGFYSAVKFF